MAYSFATLQNALDALDARLYDTAIGVPYQFWTQAELTGYIRESLRTFNALAQFWRAEMTFNLVPGNWWYDLATVGGSIVPYTVDESEIISVIENHLLEPPNITYPLVWAGSTQFQFSDILSALQRREDDTLGTTACVITRSLITAALTPRTTLTDSVIDIRRVSWLPSGPGYSNRPLNQSDLYAERAFNPGYTTSSVAPNSYMQNAEPPISFDVDSVPPVAGQYDLLTVNSGPAWSAASDALMNMPDDWTWVVKWGALADLLSRESPAKDTTRAEYCRKRYEEGLALLENAPLVLAARFGNVPAAVDSLDSADKFNPGWQDQAPGVPSSMYNARNMVAVAPAPDGNLVYSATISVCQNCPVPSTPGDFIQIAKDCYDSILDIAQHLAAFKMGGDEFMRTIPLYQKAQKKAAEYNGKLKEMGFFEMPQLDLSQLQEQQGGRYLPGTAPQ